MEFASWQAPIPPPEILQGYAQVIENGAERLFAQFETEASERRAITRRAQTHQLIVHLTGRFCALTFALSALGVATYALHLGHQWAAAIIGGGAIAMVVAAFTGVPNLIRSRTGKSSQHPQGR